jgi:hypothetical protein
VENEMEQNVFEYDLFVVVVVVVVREKNFENDWLYFDFDVVVVDAEDFESRILYDEHVVVVVHDWDKYDVLLLLLVELLFDDVNDEVLTVKVEDENLFVDFEQISLD